MRESSIHLTLAFLGNVGEERLPAALLAANKAKGSTHRLPIEQAGRWRDNALVWVGPMRTPSELASLAQSLSIELRQQRFELEMRAFVAHVTLVRKLRRKASLPALPAVIWPVTEFTLVHSTLSRHGSSYTVLERFPIA